MIGDGNPAEETTMAKLRASKRNRLPSSSFAGPGRSYPIEDKAHARAALSRVSQFGSPALKARIRARVHSRYPGIGKGRTQRRNSGRR